MDIAWEELTPWWTTWGRWQIEEVKPGVGSPPFFGNVLSSSLSLWNGIFGITWIYTCTDKLLMTLRGSERKHVATLMILYGQKMSQRWRRWKTADRAVRSGLGLYSVEECSLSFVNFYFCSENRDVPFRTNVRSALVWSWWSWRMGHLSARRRLHIRPGYIGDVQS